MTLWQHIKKVFQNYFSRMAKSNQEMFGNETLDCCKLNRGQTNQQRHK